MVVTSANGGGIVARLSVSVTTSGDDVTGADISGDISGADVRDILWRHKHPGGGGVSRGGDSSGGKFSGHDVSGDGVIGDDPSGVVMTSSSDDVSNGVVSDGDVNGENVSSDDVSSGDVATVNVSSDDVSSGDCSWL